MDNKRYWHYTTYQALQKILESGTIKIATIGVKKGVRPAVWFSVNPVWENTVQKRIKNENTEEITGLLSRDGLFQIGIFPVRIEVDPLKVKLHSWNNYKKIVAIQKA